MHVLWRKTENVDPLGVLYVHRLICNWILYHVPLYYLSSCFKEAEDYEIMILKAPMYSIEISTIFTKQFYRRKLNWYFTKSFEKFICLLYIYVYTITMEPQHWWLWIFFQSEGQKVSGIYIKSVVPGGAAALVSINNSLALHNKELVSFRGHFYSLYYQLMNLTHLGIRLQRRCCYYI